MTGNTQEGYAKMMLGGGRSVEGNRSRSGKNAPSPFVAGGAAKKAAAKAKSKPKAKSKSKSKPKSAKRK
jgi:hypothetical protein